MIGAATPRRHGPLVPERLECRQSTRDVCPVSPMDRAHRQQIRYLRTRDGVQLAWAEAGSGPVLVKASNWLTHLEYDWDSPVWNHWMRFLSGSFRLVRYDERGCGMTDWDVAELSLPRWTEDLESVVDTAAPGE